MVSGVLRVDQMTLASSSKALAQVSDRVRSPLPNAPDSGAPLLAEALRRFTSSWDRARQRGAEDLVEFSTRIEATARDFARVEQAGVETFNQIRADLGAVSFGGTGSFGKTITMPITRWAGA